MTMPNVLANGPGNLPDATQLMSNFNYLEGLAKANVLINGGFEIWQRNTTFTISGSRSYTSDRWLQVGTGTTPTGTVAKETTNVDSGSVASMKINITANTSNGSWFVAQLVENYQEYLGKTVTLSVRVKASSVSGNFFVGVTDGIGNGVATIVNSGSFTTYTATLALDAAGTGLEVLIGNWFGQVGTGTFYIDNIMLVVGSVAVPFSPRLTAQEFMLCQRYYCKSYALATVPGTNVSATTAVRVSGVQQAVNTEVYGTVCFPTRMMAAPSITTYSPAGTSGKASIVSTAGSATDRTVSVDIISPLTFGFNQVVNNDPQALLHYTAESEM